LFKSLYFSTLEQPPSILSLVERGWALVLRGGDITYVNRLIYYYMIETDSSKLIAEQNNSLPTAVFLALVPIVVAFAFIIFVFYRKKREAYFKQIEVELNLKIAQVEIKALRSQINPHFIFNCLNSIHHYMHRNDIKLAGEYLIKFSQLIRYVLETSSQRMVALDDDLEALKIYMELEQLRMAGSFQFDIKTGDLRTDTIHIPPMMIQPFVENSIWHGLNQKGDGGHLKIEIENTSDGMITCIVEDNGRKRVELNDANDLLSAIKKSSLGMSLIKERLEVVSRLYNVKADFKIEDRIEDGNVIDGKRVIMVLPCEG
jgi:LytS/YehU family sensor histidine kinase